MYYCCKQCSSCCSSIFRLILKCYNSICSFFGNCFEVIFKCCGGCCESILKCCGATCDELKKIFNTPFSCCAFVSFFITTIPFILAIIGIARDNAFKNCEDPPIAIHLIIEGICNLGNFIFCLYLAYRYGEKYKNHGQNYQDNADRNVDKTETNILERTKNLILYDFGVCFYIFYICFSFIWTIIGFIWLGKVEKGSVCYENNAFTIKIDLLNTIIMIIFIFGGLFLFCCTLLVSACDEGSCQIYDFFRCCLLVSTCGLCDVGKRIKKKKTENVNNHNSYWISTSKNILKYLGFYQPQVPFNNNQNNLNMPQPQPQMVVQNMPPPYMISPSSYANNNQANYNNNQQITHNNQNFSNHPNVYSQNAHNNLGNNNPSNNYFIGSNRNDQIILHPGMNIQNNNYNNTNTYTYNPIVVGEKGKKNEENINVINHFSFFFF